MIIPNLLVTDMPRAVAFYRDVLGMTLTMAAKADRSWQNDGDGAGAVFAIMTLGDHQLMLQTASSLAEDIPSFSASQQPAASGTIYFRGLDPDVIDSRVNDTQRLRGPVNQWYGMREIYIRDPDGYIICVGKPDGNAPS